MKYVRHAGTIILFAVGAVVASRLGGTPAVIGFGAGVVGTTGWIMFLVLTE